MPTTNNVSVSESKILNKGQSWGEEVAFWIGIENQIRKINKNMDIYFFLTCVFFQNCVGIVTTCPQKCRWPRKEGRCTPRNCSDVIIGASCQLFCPILRGFPSNALFGVPHWPEILGAAVADKLDNNKIGGIMWETMGRWGCARAENTIGCCTFRYKTMFFCSFCSFPP